ncbi:MAG: hypothetical protein JW760_10505 [Spirochaetales bacterium]|nr:hypothetical protein [Spirochaetales bacterium]
MKRILVIITAVLAVSACGFGPPSVPTGLTASEDLHNKIELSWTGSPNAGVYYVYRGAAAGLTGSDEEYLGSTAINAYIDTTVETEVPYWYAVSAADPFGKTETALSEEVQGIAPDLIWSLPVTVAESTTAAVLTAGGTSPIIVTATAGSPMGWYEFDEETGWTAAAESPGTATGAGIITAAIIGGALHAAFTDAASSPAGKVTVRRYSDDQWETLGTPHTPIGTAGTLSLASSGFPTNEVYLGYLDDTDGVTVRYYPDAVNAWANLGTPDDTAPATFLMITSGGVPYFFYEESSATLEGRVYDTDTGVWTALPDAVESGGITPDFMAAVTGTDSIYLAYSASAATLSVKEYSAGAWSDLASISSVETSGPVDLAVLNGTLYAAYVTATETVVSRYVDEEWEITAVNPGDTLAAAADLDLETHGGSLRLLTVTGGKAEVRTFE